MARRMIPVRNRATGQTTTVSERAYPLFADSHERLDQTVADPHTQADADPAKSPRRAPAPKSNKE
jgi:hypothetical protein